MNPISFVLIIAIASGALFGYAAPKVGESLHSLVDYTLLLLVGLLFFNVRFSALIQAITYLRFILIALVANFLVIPILGYGIAFLFLSDHPLFMIGLVIYFMSPCTDWFLSFTRLADGNTALGTILIPINITVQLLLYPFFIEWFTQNSVQVEANTIGISLLQWFIAPLAIALLLRLSLQHTLTSFRFKAFEEKADRVIPWITAMLVLQLFAGNIGVILDNAHVFVIVLLAVFAFFMINYLLGELLSRLFRLSYPDHVLLSITIAARNAPLMLAVSVIALPDQPLIYAALIIGMLIEFPHLTALRNLLIANKERPNKLIIKHDS